MGPPLPTVTYSWIGLTALTPLIAMLITWTIISIHKRRLKSILLLAIIYSQLFFQLLNFSHSTLSLLKLDKVYVYYLNYGFNILILFKSLSVLSVHLEEFYKLKSPSNYILNVNSSLLKYHLLVLLTLSLMGSYFLRGVEFIPDLSADLLMVAVFITFHILILFTSLLLLISKILVRKTRLDISVMGTNSTSSSANLFGVVDGGRAQATAASAVAATNLTMNVSLVVCVFSPYWLPPSWPLSNILTWSQLLESLLTPTIYWLALLRNRRQEKNKNNHGSHGSYGYDYAHHPRFPITNGSLCFNNGEFKYFAGGKNASAMVLNNSSSEYNTFDSFHQTRSYSKDSLRCASVTTIANDDFEFLSRAPPPTGHLLHVPPLPFTPVAAYEEEVMSGGGLGGCGGGSVYGMTMNSLNRRAIAETAAASLSMNDLDLIECNESEMMNYSNKCSKYKKNSNRMRRRFGQQGVNGGFSSSSGNSRMNRRVLSLESLHNHVNESHLAYLDTGERVILFTTEFL